jgi:hypothetical protein
MSTQNRIEAAFRLACSYIADGPQSYEEANTPEGWAGVFLDAAESGKPVRQVISEQPTGEMMSEGERRRMLKDDLNVDAANAGLRS